MTQNSIPPSHHSIQGNGAPQASILSNDPATALNAIFKSQEDLQNIDQARSYVGLSADLLQLKIANLTVPTEKQAQARAAAGQAPEELADLVSRVAQIQQTGNKAREDITAMTSDIQRLDRTKDNLVQSITMLKRLQMLTKVYTQLEGLLAKRQYEELNRTLAAASELTEYFRPFRSVKQIADLSRRLADLESNIQTQIETDIRDVISGKPDPSGGTLSSAAEALTILPSGDAAKDKMVDWYSATMLRDYTNVFRIGDEASSLENISSRYAFLKRVFAKHRNFEAVFPAKWHMDIELVRIACDRTREDIKTLSTQFASSHGDRDLEDIQLLLNALHETTEFEKFLVKATKSHDFDSAISPAFLPHLSIWVDYQDKQLAARVHGYRSKPAQSLRREVRQNAQGDGDGDSEVEPDVIPSSADLFFVYRQVLSQMVKLSRGEPLYALSRIFGKWLSVYSRDVLRRYIPETPATADEVATAAMALTTADYCIATVRQLKETIVGQVEDAYKEKVDFTAAEDSFLELSGQCISSLVRHVDYKLEPAWREMANTNWGRISHVSDQSSYVAHLSTVLRTSGEAVLKNVAKFSHKRSISGRIVDLVCSSFVSTVMRARPILEIAAEQMLLDLYAIKNVLLGLLHSPEAEEGLKRVKVFQETTAQAVSRVEAILKVLLTRADPPEMLVQNYVVLIKDRSTANFRKVLEIKGIRNAPRLIDMFHEVTSQTLDLQPESALLAQASMNRAATTARPTNSPLLPSSLFDRERERERDRDREREHTPTGNSRPGLPGAGVFKFNENFRKIGDLLRRDSPRSPSPSR